MTYQEAKARIARGRLGGIALMVVGMVVTVIGLLKFMYVGLDEGDPLLAALALEIKRLVYYIYEGTQFLSLVWKTAPSPDLKDPVSSNNVWFLFWYFCIFAGAALLRSGNRLAARLRGIQRQIEDELIRASIQGMPRRTRAQIETSVEVPKTSIWKETHTLYIAPVVVGLILLILGRLLGLGQ